MFKLSISKECVSHINDLQYQKICAKWFLHMLTAEKASSLKLYHQLSYCEIKVANETCAHHYQEMKHQSMKYHKASPGEQGRGLNPRLWQENLWLWFWDIQMVLFRRMSLNLIPVSNQSNTPQHSKL